MPDSKTHQSAIGGSSQLGTQQQVGNLTLGVMPEQIVKELQTALRDSPGTDFIVIQRVRQGEEPRAWSTGDQEQTRELFQLAYNSQFSRT